MEREDHKGRRRETRGATGSALPEAAPVDCWTVTVVAIALLVSHLPNRSVAAAVETRGATCPRCGAREASFSGVDLCVPSNRAVGSVAVDVCP